MKVVILAAGYGTRMYPQTKRISKPLLRIGKRSRKRPIIDYLLDKIDELDNISRIVIVTNNKFFHQYKRWKGNLKRRYPIRIINDLTTTPENKLGAIGDINFTFKKEGFSEDFLVIGGDNFLKDSLVDFMRFAESKKPFTSIGLFDIKKKKEAIHYGVVSLNSNNRIVDFCEKPAKPKSSLVAMCLYYFPKTKLKLVKEYISIPTHFHDTTGSYIDWLSSKDKAYGFVFCNTWFDVGHKHTYSLVNSIFEGRK